MALAPAVQAAGGSATCQPGPARYGVATESNVPVAMSDGKHATGADQVAWYDALAPWSSGEPALTAQARCGSDDRAQQVGDHALTYTMDAGGKSLAGPSDVTLYLSSTTQDAQVHATIDGIAPDGTSVPVTLGAVLRSMRQVDPAKSWHDRNGNLVTPYHPFTVDSSSPMTPGGVTRLDIGLFGTVWRSGTGHELRLTITMSDHPWAVPSAAQVTNLAGGVYAVQRNAAAASFVDLPPTDTENFSNHCEVCS